MAGDDCLSTASITFDTIHVIESLPLGEPRTGEALYDSLLAPGQSRGTGPKATNRRVTSKLELLALLNQIATDAEQHQTRPLLHFESHGSPEGLGLADETLIAWEELSAALLNINLASKMNLLVFAAMCHGWYMLDGALPSGRSPVFAVVGPPSEKTFAELEAATTLFYSDAVLSGNLESALLAMNGGAPFKDWTMRPGLAEIAFCRAFRSLWQSSEMKAIRHDREITEVGILTQMYALSPLQSASARLKLREILSDPRFWYDELKQRAMMTDIFPENRKRSGLTYTKCAPAT